MTAVMTIGDGRYVRRWSPKVWRAVQAAIALLDQERPGLVYVTAPMVAVRANVSRDTAQIALRVLHHAGVLGMHPANGSGPALYVVRQ